MDPELEAYVRRAQDPALIPGIYNYCHHRCEQCAFTGRCYSFREEQREAHDHPERSLEDHIKANFSRAAALMKAWCEQHGIDPAAIEEASEIEDSDSAPQDDDEMADASVLQQTARKYCSEAYRIV